MSRLSRGSWHHAKDFCYKRQYVREVSEEEESNSTCGSLPKGVPLVFAWSTGCKAKELSPGHFQYRFSSYSAVKKRKTGRGYCCDEWPLRMAVGWEWGELWFIDSSCRQNDGSRTIWPFSRLTCESRIWQNCWPEEISLDVAKADIAECVKRLLQS